MQRFLRQGQRLAVQTTHTFRQSPSLPLSNTFSFQISKFSTEAATEAAAPAVDENRPSYEELNERNRVVDHSMDDVDREYFDMLGGPPARWIGDEGKGRNYVPFPYRPPGESFHKKVKRIMELDIADREVEVYRYQKELLFWRRKMRLPKHSRAQNRAKHKFIRGELNWRNKEYLGICDALRLVLCREKRIAQHAVKKEADRLAQEELGKLNIKCIPLTHLGYNIADMAAISVLKGEKTRS